MYGLPSMSEQLDAIREESGVTFAHVDTCIGCYLQDHHNRDGECLFGVYVDGTTTIGDVKKALADEVRSTGDRVDESVTDEQIAAAIESAFADCDLAKLFDSRLESPELDEEGEPIDDDMAAEGPQAWFVLVWPMKEEED
jgi:nucleoside-diphosphate-sugar epimerase